MRRMRVRPRRGRPLELITDPKQDGCRVNTMTRQNPVRAQLIEKPAIGVIRRRHAEYPAPTVIVGKSGSRERLLCIVVAVRSGSGRKRQTSIKDIGARPKLRAL